MNTVKSKKSKASPSTEPLANKVESVSQPSRLPNEADRVRAGLWLENSGDADLSLEFSDTTAALVERLGLRIHLEQVEPNRLRLDIGQTPDKHWEFSAMGVTQTRGR